MSLVLTTSYVEEARAIFGHYKEQAEKALVQCPDGALTHALDRESNSIATIVKHLSGNMISRWTDFLTTDGEKPDRDRDGEFEEPPATRAEIMAVWEKGWSVLFRTLDSLSDADLGKTITIRTERHSVMQAIDRQVAHYSYHIGQIVFLCKHLGHESWRSISVPRKGSQAFNEAVASGKVSQR